MYVGVWVSVYVDLYHITYLDCQQALTCQLASQSLQESSRLPSPDPQTSTVFSRLSELYQVYQYQTQVYRYQTDHQQHR